MAGHDVQLWAHKENIESNQQNIAGNREKIVRNISDVEANTKRFTALTEYEVKSEATVKFSVGRTTISAKDCSRVTCRSHILAPGTMDEYGAKAPNEIKAGRAENRRVELKVLVNNGITCS